MKAATIKWLDQNKYKIVKWFAIGVLLVLFSNFVTYVFVENLGYKFYIASTIAAMVSNVMRFCINNYWIFKNRTFGFANFIKFQIGSGLSFFTWWAIANTLVLFDVHYLVAVNLAAVISTLINLIVNFLWVWKDDVEVVSQINDAPHGNLQDRLPHQVIDCGLVYKNKFFNVQHFNAKFLMYEKNYYVVEFGPRVGILVVKDDQILLVGQYRFLINGISWEIPGGKVDDGESDDVAVLRECYEETGVNVKSPIKILTYYPGLDNVQNRTTIYLCKNYVQTDSSLQDEDIDNDLKWVPLDQCISLILEGSIQDSLTVTAILAYKSIYRL